MKNRINLFNTPQHFFFDGYDIDNQSLKDVKIVKNFLKEINKELTLNSDKNQVFLIPYFNGKIKEDGGISGIILGPNFHFTCHTFCYKNTIFIDCFNSKISQEQLLSIILKYFNTCHFDLCNDNSDKKGNFGKHLVIHSKKTLKFENAKLLIVKLLESIKMTTICDVLINYIDSDNYDILQPIAESHISIHRNNEEMNIDIFSCKNFDESEVIRIIGIDKEDIYEVNRGIEYK